MSHQTSQGTKKQKVSRTSTETKRQQRCGTIPTTKRHKLLRAYPRQRAVMSRATKVLKRLRRATSSRKRTKRRPSRSQLRRRRTQKQSRRASQGKDSTSIQIYPEAKKQTHDIPTDIPDILI